MKRVGILGASGYTGRELLRLAHGHPEFEVVLATGNQSIGTLGPGFEQAYPDLELTPYDIADTDGLDLCFLALPHGASQSIVPDLVKRVSTIVDLAADFRLKDASLYPTWYGEEHTNPALLADFAFGIPELFRDDVREAPLVASAGCYVTAASLALAPLVRANAIETTGIVVDAASGLSGAGKKLTQTSHFATVDENFTAYGLLNHRHTPEIEQAIGAQVLFTPHLAPMTRGILATCYARPTGAADAMGVLTEFYREEPFVVVTPDAPATKDTLGSNYVRITARTDPRTGWVVVIAALDNLVKGASGQAVQCANLALGLPETTGLTALPVNP